MFYSLPTTAMTLAYATPELVVGEVSETTGIMKLAKKGAVAIYSNGITPFLWMLREQCNEARGSKSSSKTKSYGDDFYTFDTYEQAMDIFVNKPYSLVNFKEKADALSSFDQAGIDITPDVWGDSLSMERVIRGQPDVYDRFVWGNPLAVFADINFMGTTQGGIDQAVMQHRMARIVRLVDWLENMSIRTAVRGLWLNETAAIEIEVKQHHQNLDLASLAVAVHPDFLRRMVFRAREYSKTYNTSYGMSTTSPQVHNNLPKGEGISITINYYHSVSDVDRAFDDIENTITTQLEEGERVIDILK